MHALSPQMMLWDPATVGIPTPSTDSQQTQYLAPGFPTVLSQPHRIIGAVPQLYAGAADGGQGIVLLQQPQLLSQESAGREEFDSGAASFVTPGLLPGQVQVAGQPHGLVPVVMNVNGQRIIQHPFSLPGHPIAGNFVQVAEPGQTLIHPRAEGIQLLNLNGMHHRTQNNTLIPNNRQDSGHLSVQRLQEKLAERSILTPRRRSGNTVHHCDAVGSWRRSTEERSLGGNSTALRRRSQSHDEDPSKDCSTPSIESPSPNKRIAPTPFLAINRFEIQSEFWRAPDARILRKLVDIIEYYFSDECLTKNGYMLKQLSNSDSDGYISLRRVASLKRVKSQTRDIRTVAYAVRQSAKLELSEDGTMIRRKRPLPNSIEAPRFIRSVLAINLTKQSPSVEDVTSLFTPYGDLTQVRVLRPGKALPSYLNDYKAWVPDLGSRVCAVVEFENQDDAQKACREINMQNRGPNSLRVALLKPGARIRRTLYRKYKDDVSESNGDNKPASEGGENTKGEVTTSSSPNGRLRCSSESSDGSAHERLIKSNGGKNNNVNNNKNTAEGRFHYDASGSGSDTGSDCDSIGSKHSTYRIPKFNSDKQSNTDSGYSQSSSDERDFLKKSPVSKRDQRSFSMSSDNQNDASLIGRQGSPLQKKFIDGIPVGVERQPKGPVGDCRGFSPSARQI